MDGIFYIVERIFFKGSQETHSTQFFTDRLAATQRMYNIVAADLADPEITYQLASVKDSTGNYLFDNPKPIVYDRRPEPNAE